MQPIRLTATLTLAAFSTIGAATAQTGTLDQDNTSITNVADALGFAPFVYEQAVEVQFAGRLEGFVIRIAEFNASAATLPVAIYEWDDAAGVKGSQLWSGDVQPPPTQFFTNTFIDTSAAGLDFGVGDFFLIQVGDPVIDLFGWDLNLNQGWDQANSTFIALYPHELLLDGAPDPFTRLVFQTYMIDSPIGTPYCVAAANSTGNTGSMSAIGQDDPMANDLTVTASDLPLNQFGFFVTSMTQAYIVGAGGTSNGNICLGGVVGRLSNPNQILNSGATGSFSLPIDLTAVPQGPGTVGVMAGQTWSFQAWHRDGVGLGSNFTNGIEISFQ